MYELLYSVVQLSELCSFIVNFVYIKILLQGSATHS